ncbi:domain-containing protein 2 [Favolaschia claudopus]|uniref:Domain-containing protein 2 n=1 Tax=Favolaschia claudopus TaxID=2862362 RepID=A0AAW0AT61_9AGAR
MGIVHSLARKLFANRAPPSSPLPPPPPLPRYPIPLFVYITSLDEANSHLALIQDGATIGLDLESMDIEGSPKLTKAQKRARLAEQRDHVATFAIDWSNVSVCLAQIATESGDVFVINLYAMQELPTEFSRICESPNIVKVSAGIFSDGQRLWDSFRLNLLSAASLGLFARLAYPLDMLPGAPYGPEPSLVSIVRHTLSFELPKEEQMSQWNAETLSESQKNYAAADAHASLQTYLAMQGVIQARVFPIQESWYMFDVVERVRVHRGTQTAWKARCLWWSSDPSQGFEAFR